MTRLRSFLLRLTAAFARNRADRDLDSEMQSHLAMHVEDNLRAGMGPEEARREALLKLGGLEQAKELYRDRRGLPFFDTVARDVRIGVRSLLKERAVSILCVLVLALGIGASAALFSVWKSALVFPFDFEANGRWVAILAGFNRQQTRSWFLSIPEYNDLRQLGDVFENTTILQHILFNLTDNGHPEQLDGTAVSADGIRNTGVRPILGRSFLSGEDAPGGPHIVLISESLWDTRYQHDPNILGKQIRMNDQNYTVIGVMPRYYRLWGTPLWVPLQIDYNDTNRSHRAYWVTATMKNGVTQKQVDARLTLLAHQWERQYGGRLPEYASLRLWTEEVMKYVTSSTKEAMLVLITAIAFLLVITCANVTNILLARVTARRREVAIRLALGGSRARITGQFLTESVLLALTSGAAGFLVALQGLPLIRRFVVDYVSTEAPEFKLGFSALILIAAFSVLVGLLYGIVPAIQASRTSLIGTLKAGGRTGSSLAGQWWRKALVVIQVSLALAVVASAGLMTQSYRRLSNSSLGFNPAHLLETLIKLPEVSYPAALQTQSFFRQLQQSVSLIPGVDSAGVVSSLPVADRLDRQDFSVEGRDANASGSAGGAACRYATPGYFTALQISLASGRLFTDDDREGRQLVAVVNETLAKHFWPNESPIGKHIALGTPYSERIAASPTAPSASPAPQWIAIVGVIHDTRQVSEWGVRILPEIYLPYAQSPTSLRFMRLTVRSMQPPSQILESVRQVVSTLDPSLPLGDTHTMLEIVGDSYGTERLAIVLLAIFAVVALLVAGAGVYALLAYTVSQQYREIGIRMALGACPAEVLRFVLGGGLRLAAAGSAIGIAITAILGRAMASLLYRVSANDPMALFAPALLLSSLALLACYVPARKAARVDPMTALRHE